ncbi:MAG: hypothetical protein LBL28_08020, partial [Treponema sp.]|nr:hypothetical protein [Treponema sp.]
MAAVDAVGISPDIPFTPYPNAVFYFSFVAAINEVEIPLTPSRTVESRIDENFITTITIPGLDQIYTNSSETLVKDVYLSIRNAGGTGFRLQRDNVSLLPEGRAGDMYMVNDGETAVWKFPADAGATHLLSGGVTISLPIPRFEVGHLYSLVFTGSLSALSDMPVTIANLSPQETPGFPAPTGLMGVWMNGGIVMLFWIPVPGDAYYQVYRSSDALGVYSPITDKTLTGTI